MGGRDGGEFSVASGGHPDDFIGGFERAFVGRGGGDDRSFTFSTEDLGFLGWVDTRAEVSVCGECRRDSLSFRQKQI